jgi:hypothetical protein
MWRASTESYSVPDGTGKCRRGSYFLPTFCPYGTDGFQELRVKNENRERKAGGFQFEKPPIASLHWGTNKKITTHSTPKWVEQLTENIITLNFY